MVRLNIDIDEWNELTNKESFLFSKCHPKPLLDVHLQLDQIEMGHYLRQPIQIGIRVKYFKMKDESEIFQCYIPSTCDKPTVDDEIIYEVLPNKAGRIHLVNADYPWYTTSRGARNKFKWEFVLYSQGQLICGVETPLTHIESHKTEKRAVKKLKSNAEIPQNNGKQNLLHLYLQSEVDVATKNQIQNHIAELVSSNGLFAELNAENEHGFTPFMNSVYYKRHELGIDLLNQIDDAQLKRETVMHTSPIHKSNVLHAAASKGNLEFIDAFRDHWASWGLNAQDVLDLLDAKERHKSTPLGMAEFQEGCKRKRDRAQVILELKELRIHVKHLRDVLADQKGYSDEDDANEEVVG